MCIGVVKKSSKALLFCDTPEDDSTGRNSAPLRFYDEVLPITIPAKTVYTVKLHGGFWNSDEHFSQVWKTIKIMLTYRNSWWELFTICPIRCWLWLRLESSGFLGNRPFDTSYNR